MTQTETADRVRSTLATVDWRRRTFDLYRRARAAATPEAAHALWREGRDAMFAGHPASPLLPEDAAAFSSLPVPDYDPAWRFRLRIEEAAPQSLDVETGTDGVVHFDRLGVVEVPGVGTLDVWSHGGYAGGLFVPVKDAGAGKPGGTYGGGRYLLDTIKGADLGGVDGELVLDFNFAYNPSCAYDPAWACPLAPPGNTVPVAIPVGERYGS
ncbi:MULTISPECIES: DUF1684 domain-containing protein [unclassified Curtobacterium]|uniref:DUF1684 domain-containing protein n=1 Tax=unclassified Curtobacterium TaxID=257496 RepID=UPI000D8A02BD|nr:MULTISPECIES: DUF1684 domain-containing protein [unclassified Curtobacterium]PYY41511.1 hypothetical protein DEJ32_03960 [Curtobacterium sp. MCPF17_046]WIB15357.1 DUF1684 domain-containing protein [Curtobacterium sp. MCPF17_050]